MKKPKTAKLYMTRLLQILFASLFVGIALSLFGIRPLDVIVYILKVWRSTGDMGWGTIGAILNIVLLGAMIVVPIFIVVGLFKFLMRPFGVEHRLDDKSHK